jgi:hypothetical protein
MKYAILLFVCLLAASSSRADSGDVTEYNVGGIIKIANGAAIESIVFDVQFTLTPYASGTEVYATEIAPPYLYSSGPLPEFNSVGMITSGPTYLAFGDTAGDEIDLEFGSAFSNDLTGANGPRYAYVYGCQSDACKDNYSIDGLTLGIFYMGTFDVTVTSIPVVEPSEVGMLLVGLVFVFVLARSRSVTVRP